jgi:acyl transferase domain-containing protein
MAKGEPPPSAPRDGAPSPDSAVAVVGTACRLPGGASSPDRFWDLLMGGVEAIGPAPARAGLDPVFTSIGPDAAVPPGRSYTRSGGWLEQDLRLFDPSFFGISDREAASIDPQQRLLLEVAFEALEDAGVTRPGIDGSRLGVFVGISGSDFGVRSRVSGDPIDAFAGTGSAPAVACGRLSYVLDASGPSMSIDTACSSSLVAVHLAMGALRRGEADIAIAAGVQVLLDPAGTVFLCALGALSRSGKCRPFCAEADGYVRGEGCGAAVLCRLSDAQAQGLPVLAILQGSATNHDGRSNGLTAPNPRSQEAVLLAALRDAGASADEVGFVECHGTGTTLGDAIEAAALGEVFGPHREAPVLLGTCKAQIGHLEAAAGIVGLLKAVEVVRRGLVPPNLVASAPSPKIRWGELPLLLASEPTPLTGRVVVSAFGIGGTNAAVVLGPPARPPPVPDSPGVLALSAPTQRSAAELAGAVADELDCGLSWSNACATAALGRQPHRWRVAVAASDAPTAADRLRRALPRAGEPRVAFLYTGQGGQRARMGAGLVGEPAYDEALARCVEACAAEGHDLRAVWDDDRSLRLTEHAQPALVALAIALTTLLRSWGLRPDVVAGHSLGELPAAWAAGALPLQDVMRLAVRRGRLVQSAPAGSMAVVHASAQRVRPLLGEAFVAADNGAAEVVVAGSPDAVRALIQRCADEGLVARPLQADRPFHTPLLAPCLRLGQGLGSWAAVAPSTLWISSATGAPIDAPDWDAQLVQPVRWQAVLDQLGQTDLAVEIGPHPVLRGATVSTLRRGRTDRLALLETAAAAVHAGVPLQLGGLVPAGGRRVRMPTTPFDRKTCWPSRVLPADVWTMEWTPARPPSSARRPVAIVGEGPLAERLAEHLRSQNIPMTTDHSGALVVVEPTADVRQTVLGALQRVAALLRDGTRRPVLWLTTGVAGAGPDSEGAVAGAAIHGLLAVAAAEAPGLAITVADVVGDQVELLEPWVGRDVRDHLAVRRGRVWSGRLVQCEAAKHMPQPVAPTWLVTGGFGSVGLSIAQGLASRGARSLVLLGRRAPSSGALAACDALRASGVEVVGLQGDAGNRADLERALAEAGRPCGVVHAAGTLVEAALERLGAEEVDDVFHGKVQGALHLEAELGHQEPLVLVSSLAARIGTRGQGAYAAANAVLDAVAHRRSGGGLPAVSVGFGPWSIGMAAASGTPRLAEGVAPLSPQEALRGLWQAMEAGQPSMVVAHIDPEAAASARGRLPRLLQTSEAPLPQVRTADRAGPLGDHRMGGQPVVPITALLLWAGGELRQISVGVPLVLGADPVAVHVVEADGSVSLRSSVAHLTAKRGSSGPLRAPSLDDVKARCPTPIDLDMLHRTLAAQGLSYGKHFMTMTEAWRGNSVAYAALAPGERSALLDAPIRLRALFSDGGGPYLPVGVQAFQLAGDPAQARWAVLQVREDVPDVWMSDLWWYDAQGTPIVGLLGHRCERRQGRSLARAPTVQGDLVGALLAAQPSERTELAAGWLSEHLKQLGATPMPGESLDGIDSLTAIDLRNTIAAAGVDVPLEVMLGGLTLAELASEVVERIDSAPDDVEELPLPREAVLSHGLVWVVGVAVGAFGLWLFYALFPA